MNTQESFLPDFCSARMAFVVIILAELLAIILTLATAKFSRDYYFDLAIYSLVIQIIALSCSASLCLSRRILNQLSEFWTATLSYSLLLLISFLVIQIFWWLMHHYDYLTAVSESHIDYTLRCMGISAISSALALRYFYIQHQLRKQIESESKARIEALQARIRPHFLFNCMNTIASLTRKDPGLAEEAVENLADLFRASLQDGGHISTLGKELELCRQYLNIEHHRFGERLKCNWLTDNLPLDTRIPPLTLQPILENAIYHGIEPLAEGATIEIRGEIIDQLAQITISNPLAKNRNNEHHDGNHLAQENIRQRLLVHYNRNDLFEIREHEQNYCVIIRVPLEYEHTDR